MYENIAPNHEGKPGYETYINNKVVTVPELLNDSGYDTLMSKMVPVWIWMAEWHNSL
jgi:arylsulfatase A-like enzyme